MFEVAVDLILLKVEEAEAWEFSVQRGHCGRGDASLPAEMGQQHGFSSPKP